MTLNRLGFILLGLTILSCLMAFFACIWGRAKTKHLIISKDDDERFLRESMAIEPDNSPIFIDLSVREVINNGMSKMAQDGFSMLKGVDLDV